MATMQKVVAEYQGRQAVLAASKNPFADGVAWLDRELSPLYEARIPILDQGSLYSDLTCDVPYIWGGRFFRLDNHITRLETSCGKLRLNLPLPREEVRGILVGMVAKSGIRDAFIKIIVTRSLKGVQGTDAKDIQIYMFTQPYVWVMEPEVQPVGGTVIIARTMDYDADEIFMRTAAGGIMSIASLDSKPLKDGKLEPITKKIWDTYWAMHYDDAYSF
ncbi:aminotransferase [Aspergillus pseudoustus]|uniref:Aminotransferase n=1 Tax=Aspergillus pseudoustus TaxID=1810923 RepID=A0ABR4J804_9EURO